jgi:hypothetical protein
MKLIVVFRNFANASKNLDVVSNKTVCTHAEWKLDGSQSRSGSFGEVKYLLHLPAMELRFLGCQYRIVAVSTVVLNKDYWKIALSDVLQGERRDLCSWCTVLQVERSRTCNTLCGMYDLCHVHGVTSITYCSSKYSTFTVASTLTYITRDLCHVSVQSLLTLSRCSDFAYGLDGPGFEFRLGEEIFLFSKTFSPAVGVHPTDFFRGVMRPEAWSWPLSSSVCRG